MSARKRKGSAMIEFTLVGIPMVFLLISVFEMARGMWQYHTIAYAMRTAARYAIVHGNNCNIYPSQCTVTIRQVATKLRDAAVGILPSEILNVEFATPGVAASITCTTLQACLDPSTPGNPGGDQYWPGADPGNGGIPSGTQISRVEISGYLLFRSALSMLWPGAGPGQNYSGFPKGSKGLQGYSAFIFPATSKEKVQY